MKTSSQLRSGYLDFFVQRGHTLKASAPIVPQGDATLMFNSAGMVPFKPYYLGLKTDLTRATSAQKCFRTTDIERVGTTLRHMTFFEMLGNFAFGDYFKAEAVAWAWEYLTKEAGLDPKRLHPTVFKEDTEAVELWKKVGAPNPAVRLGEDTNFWNMGPTGPCGPCSEIYYDLGPEFASGKDDAEAEALWRRQSIVNPVARLGEDSNFWAVGPTGPCGPCSEIYFDRGPEHSCGQPGCAVGCDCDRYLEIWNLVFMQFDRQADGALKPLPRQNIDTGAGLERVTFALQGKPSPFDTDLFSPIVEKAAGLIGADPRKDPASARAFRVIADHSRAATMLMAEGVIPSNVDRGYVLRRLIRRALRYGQLLGCDRPFLHELVPATVEIFREGYPELQEAAIQIAGTLKAEEEKFLETLERGEFELNKLLDQAARELPGEKAFWLYETFGFPLELTKEICSQKGVAVDEAAFSKASARAAEAARASWKGSGETQLSAVVAGAPRTRFLGYDALEAEATVLKSAPGLVVP